jgi:uncharacterized membrane protein
MDDLSVVAAFLLSAAALAVAITALIAARTPIAGVSDFNERIGLLELTLRRLAAQVAAGSAPMPPQTGTTAETTGTPAAETPAEAPPAGSDAATPESVAAAPSTIGAPAIGWAEIERRLVENWLVWLGGAALALGGAFLVKLSIDHGLLTPPVRVVLGLLLGIGLSGAAEWLHRRETAEDAAAASYVPVALAAAGAATTFAAFYAAYALYDLLPATLAFVLLAATAGATVVQSLRHGPFVAAVGIIGAYAVPALVASDNPQALPLFAYLTVVTAGALALLRHREWWWLAWLSLAGAMLWVPLWFAGAPHPEGTNAAVYLLAQLGLFAALRCGVPRVGFLAGKADTPLVRIVVRSAVWAIAAMLLVAAHADGFGDGTLAAALLAAAGLLAFAYCDPVLDDLIAAVGVLALALLASWNLPLPIAELNLLVFRVQPHQAARFITMAILLAALLGGGGFAALRSARRPGRWAALSAVAPPLLLVITYWKLQKFDIDIAWTLLALGLAAIELVAAAAMAKRRTGDIEIETALGAYAVGVLSCTGLAAAFGLGAAWLTVALALHLPAMGWIDGQLRVRGMRWAALIVAAIVLVRLVLNPYVLDYPLGPTPVWNWLLYGYGVPAAAFIAATRQFGSRTDDWLVWVLEAGSILFSFLLLTLEADHALYGRLSLSPFDDFASGALISTLWFVFAAVLLVLGDRRQRPVLLGAGWLLLVGTAVTSALWQLVELSFWSGADVGGLVILDALLLADAVPALACAAIAVFCPQRRVLRVVARVLAAFFAFVWVTLEIRHAFQGPVELFVSSGEGEWYAYSAAWLAYAAAAFAFGLVRRSPWPLRLGLIGIGLVIGKVFLSDLGELSGVLRAMSFIGLGGALVGLGYAYRRIGGPQAAPL